MWLFQFGICQNPLFDFVHSCFDGFQNRQIIRNGIGKKIIEEAFRAWITPFPGTLQPGNGVCGIAIVINKNDSFIINHESRKGMCASDVGHVDKG